MIEKRLSWRAYFILIFFSLVVILGGRVIFMLLTNRIADEDGHTLPAILIGFMVIAFSFVLFTYLASVITLLMQIIRHKSQALYIDENGIHNTFVLCNLLAFLFVERVDFIPWSAVKFFDNSDGPYVRVKVKQITAKRIGKIIVFVLGYSFCDKLMKPKFTDAERLLIERYINSYAEINA